MKHGLFKDRRSLKETRCLVWFTFEKTKIFITRILIIIEKTLICRSNPCLLYMNLNCSINTLRSHHSTYISFAVATMFIHTKKLFIPTSNVKNFFYKLCGPTFRDDAVTWRKIIQKRRFPRL